MRYPRLFAVIFLHLTVIALSSATVIRSLEISGNSAMSSRDIAGWIVSKSGGGWTALVVREDCRIIEQQYRDRGYLAARVDVHTMAVASDSSWIDVEFVIREGRIAILGGVLMEGASKLSRTEILDRFETVRGSPLVPAILANDIDELIDRYESMGYPYTSCRVDTLAVRPGVDADTLFLGLAVAEGRQVRISEVSVEGLHETRPAVVLREARIQPGELYNPGKLKAVRQRLQRLNLFASVEAPELYERKGADGILIIVREGNTNTFDGIVGYLPSPGTGGGTVTGLVTIAMRNLFGTGRKLNVRWQREDRSSQELGFRYQEPWVFGLPVNLETGFLQRQQDSSFVRRTIDVTSALLFSEELSVSLVLTADRIIPSADSSGAGTAGLSSLTGGIEVLYDTRDDNVSPTAGVRYRADYHVGRKNATSVPVSLQGRVPESATLQRIGVDLEGYIEPIRRQVVAVAVHGREVHTDRIQPSEMERFGGATTLRGYREREFLGSRVAWTSLEYRLMFSRRSSIYGFLDTGYYFRPADDVVGTPPVEGFRAGYGLGIRVETPLGYLGVSYALGKGDSFGTGKIHISLNNEF
jgi:outer membrane protein insertion porin family